MAEKLSAAQIPNKRAITRQLSQAGIMGVTPQADRFFRKFIGNVAGTLKTAEELNDAWNMAHTQVLPTGSSQNFVGLIDNYFGEVIDIVTPDAVVAEQAKKLQEDERELRRNHR